MTNQARLPGRAKHLIDWLIDWLAENYPDGVPESAAETVRDEIYADLPHRFIPAIDIERINRQWWTGAFQSLARRLPLAQRLAFRDILVPVPTPGEKNSRVAKRRVVGTFLQLEFPDFRERLIQKVRWTAADLDSAHNELKDYSAEHPELAIDIESTFADIKRAAGL